MYFSKNIEEKIAQYRKNRRQETGKTVQRSTILVELMTKALEGVEPCRPIEERLQDIERRLHNLEVRQI